MWKELVGPETIADSFSCATVVFADIAGFTFWSSNRNPVDVFQLLELLFKEFDIVGLHTRVFKVSTIGDFYLATSGLPYIRDDHAEVMAKFLVECQKIFEVVTTELAYTLGSETTYLKLRCGLHSGPVTAGVLRGYDQGLRYLATLSTLHISWKSLGYQQESSFLRQRLIF